MGGCIGGMYNNSRENSHSRWILDVKTVEWAIQLSTGSRLKDWRGRYIWVIEIRAHWRSFVFTLKNAHKRSKSAFFFSFRALRYSNIVLKHPNCTNEKCLNLWKYFRRWNVQIVTLRCFCRLTNKNKGEQSNSCECRPFQTKNWVFVFFHYSAFQQTVCSKKYSNLWLNIILSWSYFATISTNFSSCFRLWDPASVQISRAPHVHEWSKDWGKLACCQVRYWCYISKMIVLQYVLVTI